MTAYFKPMLAATLQSVESLHYPVLVSPKMDGHRATVQNGVVYSKNNKPIRNAHVQSLFSLAKYEGEDGELIVGPPTAKDVLSKTSSGVTSKDLVTDVKFYVFDRFHQTRFFEDRLGDAECGSGGSVIFVKHTRIAKPSELLAFNEWVLNQGYEGTMIRAIHGPYKQGRSTPKEGYLFKFKEFEYDNCRILEVLEGQHNSNEATVSELGNTKRSHKKAGMVPNGTLGGFRVVGLTGPWKGKEFHVGPGNLSAADAQVIWDHREDYVDAPFEFKYFPRGCKDAPRFPGYFAPYVKGKHI